VGAQPNADSPRFHRREARIVGALPEDLSLPVPRLRWVHDDYDGGEHGWVLLAFDDVDGRHPRQPWQSDELDRVLAGLADLAIQLTPCPRALVGLTSASKRVASNICGWQLLRDAQAGNAPGLDDWSTRHLEALARLEAQAPAAVAGDTLLHFDVRADNMLVGADERVWFVDWPHASVGAAWLDVVSFAPSVTMQGGPPPEEVLARYPGAAAAEAEAVTAAVAAVAGYFTRQALQPAPPGLPTLRAFQAAQGEIARQWLAHRTGWT
jgi:aminoglycoside phosphotransferase (APT) family kinase protein